jgi:glycosyltransferase involved in cell wall biosynthesis
MFWGMGREKVPKVSVIIPTYNRAYIVSDAINSILAQTMADLEILVVDDGSTDETHQVIDAISDERLRYIYKENGGVSSARNLGMVQATGTYIAFLDSDDIWPTCFLAATCCALDGSQDHGLAYTATVREFADGRRKADDLERCAQGQSTVQLFAHSAIWPMAVLIRRSVLDNFWFDENLKICDDNDAFMRLSTGTEFIFVPDVYVTRRTSDDSHSSAAYTEGAYVRALSLERFYYRLGGAKYVPASAAKKKISHCYRRAGERYLKKSYRKAAIGFLWRAIKYDPLDVRLYIGLLKAAALSKADDRLTDWHMPEALGDVYCSVAGTGKVK